MSQWLRAKRDAAKTRMEKAAAALVHFQAAIDERRPTKRPCNEPDLKERSPNWEKFNGYTQSTYQELESKERALPCRCYAAATPLPRHDNALPCGFVL